MRMMRNLIFQCVICFSLILPTIVTVCPDIPASIPDIVTYNSNQNYPRVAVIRALKKDEVLKQEINTAKRRFRRLRNKRNAELNKLFEEDTVDTANRFILNFFGIDTSGTSESLPAGVILSPPIEVSHDEFLALREQHGGESAGSVVDITEEQFNELATKHGDGIQQTVQSIEVPQIPSNGQWETISSGEFSNWKPVLSNDQIMANTWIPENVGMSADEVRNFPSDTGGIIEKIVEFIDAPVSSDLWKTASSGEWIPVPFNSETVEHLSSNSNPALWSNALPSNNFNSPVSPNSQEGQSIPFGEMTDVISVGAHGERHTIGKRQTQLTCTPRGNSFAFKNRVNFKNTQCWVLPGFRELELSFSSCSKTPCTGKTPVGVGDRDMCAPVAFTRYDVWFYCEKLVKKFQKYILRLPQKCKCKRFKCLNN